MCFSNCSRVDCPVCPKHPRRIDGKMVGPGLACTMQNYSGCGVDIGQCSECFKYFQISYKVDEVTELDW